MKPCEKYYEEYSERMNNLYRPNIVDSNKVLLDIFLKIQIEAYNQAIDDAIENAEAYIHPSDVESYAVVDDESILKLKK